MTGLVLAIVLVLTGFWLGRFTACLDILHCSRTDSYQKIGHQWFLVVPMEKTWIEVR